MESHDRSLSKLLERAKNMNDETKEYVGELINIVSESMSKMCDDLKNINIPFKISLSIIGNLNTINRNIEEIKDVVTKEDVTHFL